MRPYQNMIGLSILRMQGRVTQVQAQDVRKEQDSAAYYEPVDYTGIFPASSHCLLLEVSLSSLTCIAARYQVVDTQCKRRSLYWAEVMLCQSVYVVQADNNGAVEHLPHRGQRSPRIPHRRCTEISTRQLVARYEHDYSPLL